MYSETPESYSDSMRMCVQIVHKPVLGIAVKGCMGVLRGVHKQVQGTSQN